MDQKFADLVETLAPKLNRLLAMPPLTDGALPRDIPTCGVYLFTENGQHLYVGRLIVTAVQARPTGKPLLLFSLRAKRLAVSSAPISKMRTAERR